jgi:hypothetical protein
MIVSARNVEGVEEACIDKESVNTAVGNINSLASTAQ